MRIVLFVLLLPATGGCAFAQLPCNAETASTHAYRIRDVRISQPFVLVPELRTRLAALEKELNSHYANTVYANRQEQAAANSIRSALEAVSTPASVTRLQIVVGRVENCADQQVDLLFNVVSLALPTQRPSIPEVDNRMRLTPASVAIGQDSGLKLLPLISYDASAGVQSGGGLSKRLNANGCKAFRPTFVDVAGAGGSQSHNVAANLGGECNQINYREWSASYLENVLPATTTGVVSRQGDYFYHHDLKPPALTGLTLRWGGELTGGSSSSGSLLGAVTSASLVGVKGAAGVTYVATVQNVEVSFGEEVERNLAAGQWFGRQVVDLRHDLWLPYGDHHDFEAESEFHAGNLFHAEATPLASTFLLNSAGTNFLPSKNWLISSTPSIRSVSSKRNVTLDSSGGKSYVAANTLLGTNVFRIPLVPTSLTSEKEFNDAVAAGENSALSALIAVYQAQEPHIVAIAHSVPVLKKEVAQLTAYLAQPSVQTRFPDDASDCQVQVETVSALDFGPLARRVNVGAIQDLTNTMDGSLTSLLQSCRDTLGAELHDPEFSAMTDQIAAWQKTSVSEYQQVNMADAEKKAAAIMAEVTPVFATLTRQVNTTSFTPMVALDYLRLVPQGGTPPVTLLGVGPALRFTLVSSVNFTLGYSFNVLSRSTTGPGAFFGSITFHDFLHF